MTDIDSTTASIAQAREEVDSKNAYWWEIVEDVCEKEEVFPSAPRICRRQTQHSNTPAESVSEHFKRNVTIPLLDHLHAEMKSSFTKHHKTVLIALCVVPSCLLSMHFEECKSAMTELVKLYEDHFPSVAPVSAELHRWRTK